ncbi:MAG: hypothetical protein WCV50_06235 [Patescibacteria group bacterium]|jgi:hypothetical protein
MENTPLTQQSLPQKSAIKPRHKKSEYVFAVICNAIGLFIINSLLKWEAQFITADWTKVLPYLNFSIILSLVVYFIFIFFDRRGFYFLGRTAMDVVGIFILIKLYLIFPFDFNKFFQLGWLNSVMPWLLLLGVIGIIIGIMVRISRLVSGKNIYN